MTDRQTDNLLLMNGNKYVRTKQCFFPVFTDEILQELHEWRMEQSAENQTFSFWDNFLYVDFMSYLGLYFSIRNRNWDLRNISFTKISLFISRFRQTELPDIDSVSPGRHTGISRICFSASISGKYRFAVALDEEHEMEINLKSKNALNSFSQSSLATLTYYLPFRAKTLHNLKSELKNLKREEGMYHRKSTRSYIKPKIAHRDRLKALFHRTRDIGKTSFILRKKFVYQQQYF